METLTDIENRRTMENPTAMKDRTDMENPRAIEVAESQNWRYK